MLEHISELIKGRSDGVYLGGTYLTNSKRYYMTVFSQIKDDVMSHTVTSIIDPLWDAKEKNAPEEVVEHAKENIDKLMDEAVEEICTHFTETNEMYVVEDASGIHKLWRNESTDKIVFIGHGYHYQYLYEKVANPLIGASKRYSATKFYEKMASEHDSISIQDALEYLKMHPDEFTKKEREKLDPNDPVVSVAHLDITRRTGNTDKKTFDFVSVEILLRSDLNIPDMREYVRKNLQGLNQRALNKIASAKRYQSFGVPVDYLTLYSIGIHVQSTIRMMYELRQVGTVESGYDN